MASQGIALTSTNATADLLACLYPSNPRVLSLLPHMRQIMRLTGALDLVSVIRGGASKFRETGSRTFRNRVRRCTPLWLTLAQHVNAGLVNFGRAYGSSGGASEQSKTRSARSYLERWAGIRDGVAHRSEAATSDSQGRGPATSSSPPSATEDVSTPTSSISRPQEQRLHVFGRRYLVPTLRIPPFPAAPALNGSGDARRQRKATAPSGHDDLSTAVNDDAESTGRRSNGGAKSVRGRDEEEQEEKEEELRVFHWALDMLQGNAAACGLKSVMPAPGSSVVLELAAVSQDGSPHGRPARRAGLLGVARAVKASGYVPVGVCNTSQDVLALAAEIGLPEVMMMEVRSKALTPRDATSGAAVVRRPRRRNFLEISSNELETASRSSALSSSASVHPCATFQPGGPGKTPRNGDEYAAPADAKEPVPVRGITGTTTEGLGGTSAAGPGAAVDEEQGEEDRLGGVDSSRGAGDATRQRETMVYHGSVRSGQQVFAEGTSLVIMGAVSSGGEVMADGDIHVYGSLRGRALAGLSGNTSSMIFATKFDAELVGIADAFTTCHDPESLPGLVRESPTNVSFSNGQLVFRSIAQSSSSPPSSQPTSANNA